MNRESELGLAYWRDRANFLEKLLSDKVLGKLAEAIEAQLKHCNDDAIPEDAEASMHAKSYRSQRIRIDTIEMSTRSANALRHQGVKTLGDLCRYTEFALLAIPNFGRGSLKEIKEILASHNLSLKPTLRRS